MTNKKTTRPEYIDNLRSEQLSSLELVFVQPVIFDEETERENVLREAQDFAEKSKCDFYTLIMANHDVIHNIRYKFFRISPIWEEKRVEDSLGGTGFVEFVNGLRIHEAYSGGRNDRDDIIVVGDIDLEMASVGNIHYFRKRDEVSK